MVSCRSGSRGLSESSVLSSSLLFFYMGKFLDICKFLHYTVEKEDNKIQVEGGRRSERQGEIEREKEKENKLSPRFLLEQLSNWLCHYWAGEENAQIVKQEVLHRKNSVRDKVIGKKWIYSNTERMTLHRVWAIAEGECGSFISGFLSLFFLFSSPSDVFPPYNLASVTLLAMHTKY